MCSYITAELRCPPVSDQVGLVRIHTRVSRAHHADHRCLHATEQCQCRSHAVCPPPAVADLVQPGRLRGQRDDARNPATASDRSEPAQKLRNHKQRRVACVHVVTSAGLPPALRLCLGMDAAAGRSPPVNTSTLTERPSRHRHRQIACVRTNAAAPPILHPSATNGAAGCSSASSSVARRKAFTATLGLLQTQAV